jgi:hypothetical protein
LVLTGSAVMLRQIPHSHTAWPSIPSPGAQGIRSV